MTIFYQNHTDMNTAFRAGWAALVILSTCLSLSAQNSASEDLARADKQFNLYAYNLALRTYDQVLQKDPKNAHAIARMADCYFQLNRPEDALPYYEKAVQQRSVEPETMLHYGMALMYTGDYVGARKWFKEYAEGYPEIGNHYAAMCDYAAQNTKKDGNYAARNEPLNTEASDYAPVFMGTRVVYNSARTDIKRKTTSKTSSDWTGSAYNQLFVTQRNPESGYLQKPGFLRSDLQNGYNEGPVSFTADGRRVAFCRNNFIDGTRQIAEKGINLSMYTADVSADGNWTNIKPFPYNGSDYATGFPCFSADGNTLLFASNQSNGYGGWDVYVSTWNGADWSVPRNVGAPLNTIGNEITPFWDGKSLYFSSDWHNGFGGMDVFRAEFGGQDVGKIFPLGPGINSSRDDYGFVYDAAQNVGYVTSNRAGGRGNEDVWQITKKLVDNAAPITYSTQPDNNSNSLWPSSTPQKPAEENNSNNLEGYNHLLVTDEQGNALANTEVDFLDCGCGTGRTDAKGKYYFETLSRAKDCSVTLRRDGYNEATVDLYNFGRQNVLVSMSRDKRQEYTGRVFDVRTKEPLYSVVVAYQVPGTDRQIQTSTDNDGRYSIYLDPNQSYDLNYSKEGYADATVRTKPGLQSASSRLADVLLDRLYDNSYTRYNADNNQQVSKNAVSKPAEYSYASPSSTILVAPKDDEPVLTPASNLTGYAVQLAAYPMALDETKLNKYQDLSKEGNLYVKSESNLNKIRLGIYPTKEEAQKALKTISKKPAYKDAFVVEERGADPALVIGGAAEPTPERPLTYSTTTAKEIPPAILYAVQIGSIDGSKPFNFNDYMPAGYLGNIYTKNENGVNKVRVGVWTDYATAEKAVVEAVAKGYKDATIVPEKGTDESMLSLRLQSVGQEPKSSGIVPVQPVQYSTPTTTPATPATKDYYVQLAALANPDRFDGSGLRDMGADVQYRKLENGLTLVMLGGYATQDGAKAAQTVLTARGYKNTYIVKEDKGRFIRL